jgi:hypothetical protein
MTKTTAASFRASVAFMKIQDFARKAVPEQTRLRAQLEAVTAVLTAELPASSRIVLDALDGAAIVVLANPEGILRLAERALNAAAGGLPLCIGINHGVVQVAYGSRSGDGMVGDGIAVAATIAEFASSSRLLVSRSFREALADAAPGIEAGLPSAGTVTDPGLRTHEVFSPDRRVDLRQRRRFLAAGVLSAVALIGGGVGLRIAVRGYRQTVDEVRGGYDRAASRGAAYMRSFAEGLRFWK